MGRVPRIVDAPDAQPCAVLVPLIQDHDLKVVFARRTEDRSLHSGQVCFPGGKACAEDADLLATALREAEEEVGIRPEDVDVLGQLDDVNTMTGYRITPYVGLIRAPYPFALNGREIAHLIEVPLQELLLPDRFEIDTALIGRPVLRFMAGDELIWGATARIAKQLADHLLTVR